MAPKNSAVYSATDGAVQDEFPDRIAEAFENKRVLITGGTGFLGKVLIEKILRKCEKVDKIIVLARPKKGKNPKQRLEEMFNGPLFTELVKKLGMEKILSKIVTVTGDTGEVALGLDPADRELCRSTHFIVHSAATVRFDEGLKRAVTINARGTKYMLDLAKECKKLELFVHLSTAYCHPEQAVLEEICYPPPADPHSIIQSVETLDDVTIETMTPKILGNYPNTYAYSKALGEALAEEAMKVLPVMILRPSVVIPIYQEPLPGWTDNLNGPIGLLIGAGKGVLRTMYGDDSGHADFIPADIVVNVLMVALWDFVKNGVHHKVLNLTTSAEIQISWKEVLDIGRTIATEKYPFDYVAWYPGGCMTSHRWLHNLRALLFHWLPAILVDTILFCLGIKPVLLRVHRRIHKGSELIEFYTSNQWVFKSDFAQQLRIKLNPNEKVAYKMDAEGVDIVKYFEHGVLAARRYILKEKDENLPRAKTHIRIMYFVDMFVKVLFFGLLFKFIFNRVLLPVLNFSV